MIGYGQRIYDVIMLDTCANETYFTHLIVCLLISLGHFLFWLALTPPCIKIGYVYLIVEDLYYQTCNINLKTFPQIITPYLYFLIHIEILRGILPLLLAIIHTVANTYCLFLHEFVNLLLNNPCWWLLSKTGNFIIPFSLTLMRSHLKHCVPVMGVTFPEGHW